jgi:transcriptional regulator with XRE-family HTH domain
MTKQPHPIDSLVGANLKRLRIKGDMSQSALATKICVSYQLLQKYERSANRIAASILWECAKVLGVPVSAFFREPPCRSGHKSQTSANAH